MRQYNRIKAVLKEKGIKNLWLAEATGKSDATVSRWCSNSSQPSLEVLFQVAEALQVDPRELLNVEEEPG